MVFDGFMLFSTAVIALILWMMAYFGFYAYLHLKKDLKNHLKRSKKALEKADGLA